MSQFKRAARSLVETRSESFRSVHGEAESRQRLEEALRRAHVSRPWPFQEAWHVEDGAPVLTVTYSPAAWTRPFLNATSLVFVALVAASAWLVMKTEAGALRFLLPLFTALAVLAFPLVSLGMASSREARESRIRRAIRAALQDADEAYPPPQRWADEA